MSSSSSPETPIGRCGTRLVVARPRPSQRQHLGEAGPSPIQLDLLADPRRAPLPAAPVDLAAVDDGPLPFELLAFERFPSVIALAGEGDLRVIRGRPHRDAFGGLLFDTDQEPATVVIDDWLVDVDGGRLQIWRLSDPSDEGDRADDAAALYLPPWPGLDAILHDLDAAAWLRNRLHYLEQSADPVDKLVAAGSVVRLWTPVSDADRKAALDAALAGDPQPRGRVRDWVVGVRGWPALRDLLVQRAERWAVDVAGLVERMAVQVDGGRDEQARMAVAHEEAARLLTERDDLASIERVLRVADEGDATVTRALDAADRAAFVHGTVLDDLILVDRDDQWLRTVSRKEPDHWWGAYVR